MSSESQQLLSAPCGGPAIHVNSVTIQDNVDMVDAGVRRLLKLETQAVGWFPHLTRSHDSMTYDIRLTFIHTS